MARRVEEAENHWPGFVDALSTIVMVVTFLLIILGIVIFVISQNVARQMMTASSQVEQPNRQKSPAGQTSNKSRQQEARQKSQVKQNKADAARSKADAASNKADAASNKADAARDKADAARDKADAARDKADAARDKAASFRQAMSEELTSDEKVKAKDKLAVRARQVEQERQVVVATEEKAIDLNKVRIDSSQAMLTLTFQGGVKIADEASNEIRSFMQQNDRFHKDGVYEVRAFANPGNRSISEARRLAYYRALATRNELLGLGIDAKRIRLKVTLSKRDADRNGVKIYLK